MSGGTLKKTPAKFVEVSRSARPVHRKSQRSGSEENTGGERVAATAAETKLVSNTSLQARGDCLKKGKNGREGGGLRQPENRTITHGGGT